MDINIHLVLHSGTAEYNV